MTYLCSPLYVAARIALCLHYARTQGLHHPLHARMPLPQVSTAEGHPVKEQQVGGSNISYTQKGR